MDGSRLYLGADAAYERQLRESASCDLRQLHRGAQRIAWGIILGERVGIDLDVEVERLLRTCGEHFAAHVGAAFARRSQRREADADRHLARARELLPPSHPWAAIVPDDARFRETLQSKLVEEVPGRVYRVISDSRNTSIVLGNRGVGRFLRMRSGELLFINPVALTPELAEQVRALGEVTHLIAPAKLHSDHVPAAQSLFPKARAFGVPGHRGYKSVSHVRFDGYLDDDVALFPDELDHVEIRGTAFGDVWLIDRASSTLIMTDAMIFANLTQDVFEFASAFDVFYAWAWGLYDRSGIPSYQPAMWPDFGSFQASVRRALELDFEHVGSCHGSFRCVDGAAKSVLAREFAWVLAIGKLDALGLLGRFVRDHPGVFYRLSKEALADGLAQLRAAQSAAG